MAIVWSSVSSSNVAEVGFDDETNDVLVTFKNGSTYAYANQGESVYQDLCTDPSPGAYVARHLRNAGGRRVS